MRALVLAAGKGKRLRPYTEEIPKPLIKIANRPLISYIIDRITSTGIGDIVFVIGHHGEEVADYVEGEAGRRGFKASFIYQRERMGTGHALQQARGALEGESFLLIYGDLYFNPQVLPRLLARWGRGRLSGMMALVWERDASQFGVVKASQGRVIEILEKPGGGGSGWINAGIYLFHPSIFQALDETGLSERGEYELTTAINLYTQTKAFGYLRISRRAWIDVGRPWDVLEANKRALKELTGPSPSPGRIYASALGRDVKIGEDTWIGPYTSLDNGVEVGRGCRISHTVVMEDAVIGDNCSIHYSLIGPRTMIGSNTTTRYRSKKPLEIRLEGRSYPLGRRYLGAILGGDIHIREGSTLHPGQIILP